MNLVGKIFIVLIFLMCVVFGTFGLMVHAAHKNWKQEVVAPKVGLDDQLKEAKKVVQGLMDDKKVLETALAEEKDRTRRRLTALDEELRKVTEQRDASEARIKTVETDERKLAVVIEVANKNIGVLQTTVEGMQKDIKLAVDERNLTQKKLVDTTDLLNNAVAERERLEKLGAQLAAQIVKQKQLLDYSRVTLGDLEKYAPPGTRGEVTAVPRPDTVEISLGADDGVRKGFKFTVTRPSTGKYVGVIEVIQVDYPNRAVCRPDTAMQNDQIQKGDHVKAITKTR